MIIFAVWIIRNNELVKYGSLLIFNILVLMAERSGHMFLSGNAPKHFISFEYGWFKKIDFEAESKALLNVLNNSTKENDIQRYIKSNKKWFIPAAIFKDFDFGHHEAYLVPEQPLGAEYKVDYMLIGRNSGGHHIVLVEFEDVNVDYKIKSYNMETESVRKGLAQIKDWKRWMDENRVYFLGMPGLCEIRNNIPTWGFIYCMVVSRRERMDDLAYQMRSQTQYETPGLHIITYDRLVDNVKLLGNGF